MSSSRSNSSRPVYVPPHQRKKQQSQKQPRFHGAFTGGFSAGYFNTVDTKEGWQPSTEKRTSQTLDDFMDEQDHQEWGGPTKVRQEYTSIDTEKNLTGTPSSSAGLESLLTVTVTHQTIGPRLLRRLGWRDGTGTAFVPSTDDVITKNMNIDQEEEETKVLSKKQLRKIQLLQKTVKLPPPKLDQCGLGFEPHKNAPEFQKYRERRQQLARERATRGGSDDNIYRASHLTNDKANETSRASAGTSNTNTDYLNYETAEDFVGKRSVGGFALNDDDDDAYDNQNHLHGAKPTEIGDEYNMEVYEHESEDDNLQTSAATAAASSLGAPSSSLGGILASWANPDQNSSKKHKEQGGLTSDGRPPLAGFVLGGSMESHKKRYNGPDIPIDRDVNRHVFGENEHPLIFQTLARAVQLLQREKGNQKAAVQAFPSRTVERPKLGTGNHFAGLATAMKNRFTTTTNTEGTSATPQPVGLHIPTEQRRADTETFPTTKPEQERTPIVLKRTLQPFAPHPLVCKRFHVPLPKHAIGTPVGTGRLTEATYFEKEILTARENQKKSFSEEQVQSQNINAEMPPDDEAEEPIAELERPSMEKLKSIFEPPSEEDDDASSDADTDLDSVDENQTTEGMGENTTGSQELVVYDHNNIKAGEEPNKDEHRMVKYDSSGADSSSSFDRRRRDRHRKERRRKKHRRRHRKRSRSSDTSLSDNSTGGRQKKERRRKHEKKRPSQEDEDNGSTEERLNKEKRRRQKSEKEKPRSNNDEDSPSDSSEANRRKRERRRRHEKKRHKKSSHHKWQKESST